MKPGPTGQTLQIRAFTPADESAVVALWEACGLIRPWNNPHQDIARKLTVQPDMFLVGALDGAANDPSGSQLVASVMAGYEGHRGWVNYLAVAHGHRRAGYGKVMMQAVEERLLAMGCPKLNLQIRAENTAIAAFYESLGYSTDAAISMSKRLIED